MRKKCLLLSLFSLIISFVLFSFGQVDFSALAQGNDSLGFYAYGDLYNGLGLSAVDSPKPYAQTATWTYTEAEDYLHFRDSTVDIGFRLQLYMSSSDNGNFVYNGSSAYQSNIDASNFVVWGGWNSQTSAYQSATFGVDDDSKTLNLFSSWTCAEAQSSSQWDFNTDLLSGDFGITMSSSTVTYLTAQNLCEAEGELDIRRVRLTYPEGSNSGTYTSELVMIIVDGYGGP